jgi:hypothetical protein
VALAARPAAGPRLEFLVRSARRRHQLVARVVFEARHSLLCEGLVVDEHLLKAAAELDQQLLPPLLERQRHAHHQCEAWPLFFVLSLFGYFDWPPPAHIGATGRLT